MILIEKINLFFEKEIQIKEKRDIYIYIEFNIYIYCVLCIVYKIIYVCKINIYHYFFID